MASQEAAVRAACERNGWHLLEFVTDEGQSGKDLRRPGLSRALEIVATGEASGLVAAKLDRITRSLLDFASLVPWFDEVGATLVALDLGIDTSTPGGAWSPTSSQASPSGSGRRSQPGPRRDWQRFGRRALPSLVLQLPITLSCLSALR